MGKNSCTSMESSDCNVDREKRREIEGGDDIDLKVLLEMSGVFSVLLGDIFLDIMSRVPLESLSQCRWVCKSWYNLIKSPRFAKIQFQWAIKNSSPWVFFWSSTKNLYLVGDQVFDRLQTSVTARNLELKEFERAFHTGKSFGKVFEIVGVVNGLLCFNTDPVFPFPSPFYVCNPVTGEYITIPKPPDYIDEIAAFGFDPTTDEYKVICFSKPVDKDGDCFFECKVNTLGSNQWRKIEGVPRTEFDTCHTCLKGNLHWLSHGSESDSKSIVTFSVGAEKFSVIQLPRGMLRNDYSFKRLGVVEEHLSVFVHKADYDKPYEIWVMEEYGVQCSWVKKYNLFSELRNFVLHGYDLIQLRNGEFLVQLDNSDEFLAYLDPKKDSIRRISVTRLSVNHHLEDYFRSVVQVGSLFSPKAIGTTRGML